MSVNKYEASKALDEYLGMMDLGPTECTMTKLLAQNPKIADYLKFSESQEFLEKAQKIQAIIDNYKSSTPNPKKTVIPLSVAHFIFHSNKIENCGTKTVEDTLRILIDETFANGQEKNDVLSTYDILQSSFDPKSFEFENVDAISQFASPNGLKQAQKKLLKEDPREKRMGNFRNCGVQTMDMSHTYPHHSLIMDCISNLHMIIDHFLKEIPKSTFSTETSKRTLRCFALAAFSQFHFVDIHPFEDGNGRICRLLSKVILDAVLPFPFPMFKDRTIYFETLVQGRKENDPLDAPKRLLALLLDSALDFYVFIEKNILKVEYTISIISSDEHFEEKIEKFDKGKQNCLRSAFSVLKEGEHGVETLENGDKVLLKKLPQISFDDL